MSLITKDVDVRVTSNMLKYYLDLGYACECGDVITVKIDDLPLHSNKRVSVKCDICGTIYELQYCDYTKKTGQTVCKKCKYVKIVATNRTRYGVDNVFQVSEFQEKQKDTVREKYGCDNVFQNEYIKQKIVQSNIQKYGVSHCMRNPEIAYKVLQKRNETLYANGNCPCSSQQRYVNSIIGGELNKLFCGFWLDIYFDKNKIYIEWDGSGHDMQVKLGKITYQEFYKIQRNRENILNSYGLKECRIISRQDIIPTDNELIYIKNLSFQILEVCNKVVFDIDNNAILFNGLLIQHTYEI